MLESLSTEKNSLVFQLERLEQQINSAAGSSSNGSSINMAGVDRGEGKKQGGRGWGLSREYFIALISNLANSNMI